uniref:Uncharacterized protein n=1 Tax=viral metagenome TaxID=1070528 RepID=A0A6C0ER65_9ZZZZ
MDKTTDINTVKKELEIAAMKQSEKILLTNKNANITQDLYTIIKKSEEEFIKQTGRTMTYGEMREMFG